MHFSNSRFINKASFILYITSEGTEPKKIVNEGGAFNDELLKIVKNIKPGMGLIFDQVQVYGPDGCKRIIQAPGMLVE